LEIGWLDGWTAGGACPELAEGLDGWMAGRLEEPALSLPKGWMAGWLDGWMICGPIDLLICRFADLLI
jgi:hypothetical protein